MRRVLLAIFVTCLVADVAVLGWIAYALRYDRVWLLDVREALFSKQIADADGFDAPPEALLAQGFRTDPPELVEAWRERLPREVDYLRGVPETLAGRSELEIVRTLVPLFSKNGGGSCGHYRDLLDNVQRLPRGEGLGCCSDHVQVLIALGSSLGLFVRQVHHMSHTMAEVWVRDPGQWVFVDPHYAVMARDPDGAWLSLRGIRERYQRGAAVDWVFFGTDYHRFATIRPLDFELYDSADDFQAIRVLWGNNVFQEDRFDRRLGFAPRPARQLVGLVAGVLPEERMLADEPARAIVDRLERRRTVYLSLAALLAAGTLLPPVLLAALGAQKPRR